MFKFKQSLVTFAGLSLVIGLISLVTPRTGLGQKPVPAPPAQSVNVINSESQPVPVTGTVSVSNLGDSPLPVREVDSPGRQPFSISIGFSIDAGDIEDFKLDAFTVPAGKRLVVEDATARVLLLPGGQRAQASLTKRDLNSNTNFRDLTLTYQLTFPEGNDLLVASEPVRMYLEPGEKLGAYVIRSTLAGSSFGTFRVSGYFVDVPPVPVPTP